MGITRTLGHRALSIYTVTRLALPSQHRRNVRRATTLPRTLGTDVPCEGCQVPWKGKKKSSLLGRKQVESVRVFDQKSKPALSDFGAFQEQQSRKQALSWYIIGRADSKQVGTFTFLL